MARIVVRSYPRSRNSRSAVSRISVLVCSLLGARERTRPPAAWSAAPAPGWSLVSVLMDTSVRSPDRSRGLGEAELRRQFGQGAAAVPVEDQEVGQVQHAQNQQHRADLDGE